MIRFANKQDIDAIMQFIDEYWKKDHILARDKNFFCYQHMYGQEITYLISEDDETKEMNGILGYIPYGNTKRDVMTVLWKVNHTTDPMLGIRMLQYLMENADVRVVASPGINKKTRGIYEFLGYHTGMMKQWYRLRKQDSYHIAVIENSEILPPRTEQYELIRLDSQEVFEKEFDYAQYRQIGTKPYKEKEYFIHRYFEHPIYHYDVWGIRNNGQETKSVLVTRIQEYQGAQVFRLVDCIGDFSDLGHIADAIDRLLDEYGCEYMDMYETGLPDEMLRNGGWTEVEISGNIIPNYFAPYEQKNVKLAYFTTDDKVVLLKGDGDQDRPS